MSRDSAMVLSVSGRTRRKTLCLEIRPWSSFPLSLVRPPSWKVVDHRTPPRRCPCPPDDVLIPVSVSNAVQRLVGLLRRLHSLGRFPTLKSFRIRFTEGM